jgi:CMP-N,N'-diacetyllegionaminic acid synthase
MSEILGLICARGGSKSIPRKNLALLAGKPMIAWTIEAALKSPSLTRAVVSTDDDEIAEVAKHWGADVPFLRPAELARDDTPGIEPVLHALRWLAEHESYHPDYVMLLQPTSPLRTTEDIEAAVRLARERGVDSVVSVTEAATHPYWMKRITENGELAELVPTEQEYSRRQELPPAYALNGAIYLIKVDTLMEQHTFYPDRTLAYVMPAERALDVDEPWDLYLADLVLQDKK